MAYIDESLCAAHESEAQLRKTSPAKYVKEEEDAEVEEDEIIDEADADSEESEEVSERIAIEADEDSKAQSNLLADRVLKELFVERRPAGERREETSCRGAVDADKDLEHDPSIAAYISPWHFIGEWRDSFGNKISVVALDVYQNRLQATLSRLPPRRDISLLLQSAMDGAQWYCGDAVLDRSKYSSEKLTWVFSDGKLSTWSRPPGTVSATKRWPVKWDEKSSRGLEIADRLMPGFFGPMRPPAAPQALPQCSQRILAGYMAAGYVPVLVPIG